MAESPPKVDVPPPQAIHHELRTAQNSAGYLLPQLTELRAANPTVSLLDVGAGSGSISVAFAKLLPEGHVTGIDLKPEILPRAQALADAAGATNVVFRQGDVYQLPFPDASFDVVHCHQVLAHLPTPVDALREMLRVARPGGLVAAREADYESEVWFPELPGLEKFHKFIARFLQLPGGTPKAGRQLLNWALEAGVERGQVVTTFGTWSFTTDEEKSTWAQAMVERCRSGPLRQAAIKAKLTTEEDLEEMAQAWEEWAKHESASLAVLHGEIVIQK